MKASAAQIGTAIERIGRGGAADGPRLMLFYGPDEAGAMDHAARLGRALGAAAERVDLDGAALKAQPGRLADEAAAISLFGDTRWIRVTAMGEESVEAVELLLAAASVGNPVVAVAPNAKATGKLVKLALAAPGAMALSCYPPEGEAAVRLAAGIAREHGVRLMGDTAAAMADAASGDRAVLTREIEKLALYLDAAPDRPREAGEDVLAAIGANLGEAEMTIAITAAIEGRPAVVGAELPGIEAANMTIPMLRSLAKRLISLADMRGEVDRGDSPDQVVEKHRVFWKEKRSTVQALRRWSAPQIAAGIARVRRAERSLLTGGNPATVGAAHQIVGLARSVERR
ncbi:DNA polymerase III subunit delta [Sphingomonas sp.]|uniref:DNA polymerase III subunit delta n=1 Tax=Sphingomonas sp. TaxID=28214 RepID=UPI002DD6369F|nr:DNA polymerase III subunit delta [Sphingomonas sp.]